MDRSQYLILINALHCEKELGEENGRRGKSIFRRYNIII